MLLINEEENAMKSLTKIRSPAVERMREIESNYLVLDELKEMEETYLSNAAQSLTQLKQKYADKFSNM